MQVLCVKDEWDFPSLIKEKQEGGEYICPKQGVYSHNEKESKSYSINFLILFVWELSQQILVEQKKKKEFQNATTHWSHQTK